jgi:hypothetical protein
MMTSDDLLAANYASLAKPTGVTAFGNKPVAAKLHPRITEIKNSPLEYRTAARNEEQFKTYRLLLYVRQNEQKDYNIQ